MEPERYSLFERLITGNVKATFNLTVPDIGIPTIENFNEVLSKMTKYAVPAFVFRK